MASRNDVAKLAGVSPSVVSYVLNGSNYVSQQKREAVLAAVRQLNYQPSYFGKMLKTKKTNNLALICDDIRGELFTEIAFIMEEYAYKKGCSLFLGNSHKRKSFLEGIASHKFDGIFIATSVYDTEEINYLASSDIPVALYTAHVYEGLDPRVCCIEVDYEQGTQLLVERMISQGTERIAFFPPYHSAIRSLGESDYRFRGYLQALRRFGLQRDDNLICYDNESYEDILKKAESLCRQAVRKKEKLGFIVGSDYLAVKIMNHLTDNGLFDTGLIAVAGMDRTECSRLVRPTLTTIRFSKELVANAVMAKLLPEREQPCPQHVKVPVSLVEGMSA